MWADSEVLKPLLPNHVSNKYLADPKGQLKFSCGQRPLMMCCGLRLQLNKKYFNKKLTIKLLWLNMFAQYYHFQMNDNERVLFGSCYNFCYTLLFVISIILLLF